ncbi:hypothetical protein EBS40_06500 [bacterium]|nr:hypothetical protein [bacterium]
MPGAIPSVIDENTRVPFTRKKLEERMTKMLYIADRLEQTEKDLLECEVKEMKEAYAMVYADWKWKFVIAVRDMWFWSCSLDEHKQHILKHGY